MKSRITRKLNKQGFTLTELLMTVLIMAIAAAVVAAGMPVALRAYKNISMKAEAQVFLSTSLSELKAQLSTASNVKVSGTSITYKDRDTGLASSLALSSDGVVLQKGTYGSELLVSKEASSGCVFSWETASYSKSNQLLTLSNISVEREGTVVASLDEFVIRTADYQ